MRFTKVGIPDVRVIHLDLKADSRGAFARTFCVREMEEEGLKSKFVQCNLSYNHRRGTIRGLHWQVPPATECKLIRCTRGAVYDVIVDMRPDSPAYLRHFGIELSAEERQMLYIPDQFAHGYQALTDDAEVAYQVTEYYTPELERGARYDDPLLGIRWPLPVTEVSEKDRGWALLQPAVTEVSA